MGKFDKVLLTVDFDRTLTAPDSTIPQRNLDAIEYFMAEGGAFTINTGRSTSTFAKYLDTLPRNAPLLLYNGSAAYDNGKLQDLRILDMDVWETMAQMEEMFPELNLEIQGVASHYLINERPEMVALYKALGWQHKPVKKGDDIGPFIKFALFGQIRDTTVGHLFYGSEEEIARLDFAESEIHRLYGDKVEVYRAAPRIIDVHSKGVSKLNAARDLQTKLGKEILVCVGDAENDVTMLDGADYAYCPADGVVASRYETVCNCADGAVADVIYKKIPEILGISP